MGCELTFYNNTLECSCSIITDFWDQKKRWTNRVFTAALLCPVDDPILFGSFHESAFVVHFDALLEEGGKGKLIYCPHTVHQTLLGSVYMLSHFFI